MAREYARIKTSIWNDPHFLSLTKGCQWLYHLILEQAELNLCGVIRPAWSRWAEFASDASVRSVQRDAATLVTEKYLLLDDRWDELLARTFVRHDVNLKSPNVVVGLSQAFEATHSETLRATVIQELGKANELGLLEGFPKGLPEGLDKRLARPFWDAMRKGFGNR